ncbi:MAG: hypothetical protein IVW56_13200 [Candidatus Binataceae bacterium]|nr:hypothetical protein [Candidatus Binataceae bacterium]
MGEAGILARRLTRRKLLAGTAAATIGGAALTMIGAQCDPAIIRRVVQAKNAGPAHHRVWVWQFSTDGQLAQIAANLAANRLGVMVKTHDGLDWMSTFDRDPSAVSGVPQVRALASFFEGRGVPFHAWCVVKGVDPLLEARMAADVLAAGARSLTLDLEGGSGFWQGSSAAAVAYGNELRARNAYGRVDISIDPRPWRIYLAPMDEFVVFSDGISPQCYWDTFNTPSNINAYAQAGYPSGAYGGMTPEFLVDATMKVLSKYDREIIPAGQGACIEPGSFARFVRRAWDDGMGTISAWRYGVTRYETLAYLGQNPAGLAPQPPRQPTATPTQTGTATQTPTRTPTTVPSSTSTPTSAPTNTPSPTASAAPTDTATAAVATPTV